MSSAARISSSCVRMSGLVHVNVCKFTCVLQQSRSRDDASRLTTVQCLRSVVVHRGDSGLVVGTGAVCTSGSILLHILLRVLVVWLELQ